MFEKGLVAQDKESGTGSAGDVMDLMKRLLRLREGVCVVFENERVLVEDWVLRKYVKPRILERGVEAGEAGLSVVKGFGDDDDDDDAVGINMQRRVSEDLTLESCWGTVECSYIWIDL